MYVHMPYSALGHYHDIDVMTVNKYDRRLDTYFARESN